MVNIGKEWEWKTALGEIKKFSELDHQHLSNILWFREIMNHKNLSNCMVQRELQRELEKRFNGVRLPWKPLPVSNEIHWIKQETHIRPNGDILGNVNTPDFCGDVIGSISHIEKSLW
jgi:hypothetical protein